MARSKEGTHTFCVYGSSSANTPQSFLDVSRKLGNLLADGGHLTVNGAGRSGCMGALNNGVTERCGRVRGVIHEMWIVDKQEHPGVTDLEVVGGAGLQERKRALMTDAECIITLPGGLGTWDELWEMVCLKGIGLCNLPICVIDVDDFYAGFRMQMKRAQADRLLYADMDKLVHFTRDPAKAVAWCIAEMKKQNGKRTTTGLPLAPARRPAPRTTSTTAAWTLTDRLAWVGSVIAVSAALSLASARLSR